MSKKTNHLGVTVALGTALGALFAAGAATFFFTKTKTGKEAATKLKKEVRVLSTELTARVGALTELSQKKYEKIVEDIVDQYAAQRKIAPTTVKALKQDLKSHWREVRAEVKKHHTKKTSSK